MKGVEIAFQLNNDKESDVVMALGNLTGNYFKSVEHMDITWRIFHVTLDKEKYYRVLYRGEKLSDLQIVYHILCIYKGYLLLNISLISSLHLTYPFIFLNACLELNSIDFK